MKRAAATFAFVTFVSAPAAWAQDKPEAVEATPTPAAVDASSTEQSGNGESTLDNAAVNRAFAGGEVNDPVVSVRPHRFGVYLGFRAMNVKDPGYDPYSDGDALVQNSIGVTFSPWRTRPLSLHLLAEWNMGGSSAYARGAHTNLLVNRIALGLEGRWMPKSRFYLYAKLVPSLVHLGGEINDGELGVKLESSSWTFALDASAGAALRLGTAGTEPKRTASFWLMMDWGYTFAGQASMTFRPAEIEDESRTFGAVNLPSLRPGGFVTRASFAVSF
jgi:hypothetical protein